MTDRHQQFRRTVWAHYRKEGRHALPWRPPALKPRRDKKTLDPYKILVSEVMLQQTQVDRVIPFYKNFIKKFPTPERLASASLASVLQSWQGLGYNRRAKLLRLAAKELRNLHFLSYSLKNVDTAFEEVVQKLERLPGVGPYTARAVAVFAYGKPEILVETNIRTAIIHHFFSDPKRGNTIIYDSVSDREIEKILRKVLSKIRVREWYWALMDYGAYLKRSGVRINSRSAHHVKQKPFAGSNRQARGAILRELAKGPRSEARLIGLLGTDRKEQLRATLATLVSEGLVQKQKRGKVFTLPH